MEDDKKHKLTIYLIKENHEGIEKCLRNHKKCEHLEIEISGVSNAHLFLGKSPLHPPSWHEIFSEQIDWKKYRSQTIKGLLYIQSKKGRWFAITFGYGKSYLDPFAFEENFGFKTVINSIDPESLKSIEKKKILENPLISKEQITKNTDLSQFNVDAFTDILSKFRGKSKVADFGVMLDGKDALNIHIAIDLNELPDLLDRCIEYHGLETYKNYFPQIDNIVAVRDKELCYELDQILLDRINKEEHDLVWASIPDFHDEKNFECFIYSCDRSRAKESDDPLEGKIKYYDIELKDYISRKKGKKSRTKKPLNISRDTLKRDRVSIKYITGGSEEKWSMWRCIYTEVSIDNRQYIFYDGNWYLVGGDFIMKINSEFQRIGRNDPEFPIWNDKVHEGKYLESLEDVVSGKLCLMDKKNIQHDGRSKIEFCDLYTSDKELIHVKKYGGSSVLSHLFQQGISSAELLKRDSVFRAKVEKKLMSGFSINPDKNPEQNEFTIWYVIGTKYFIDPKLPLFSRIAFVNACQRLTMYGFTVRIGYIEVVR